MAETHTAEVNGIKMRYSKFGTGKHVFCILPGLSVKHVTDSAASVERLYSRFSQLFTVYLFDARENLPENYSLSQSADDTAQIMKYLGIEKASVFGASMGGMTAMYLAELYPQSVCSIVLGSTAAKLDKTSEALMKTWAELAKRGNRKALAESFADNVYSEKTLQQYRDAVVFANSDCTDEELKHFSILADSIVRLDAYKNLNLIKCPVLVIGSKGDKAMASSGSEEIAERLNCPIFLYDSSYGHAVYDEAPDYPDRVFEFVKNFV